jgi:hypothetical protein
MEGDGTAKGIKSGKATISGVSDTACVLVGTAGEYGFRLREYQYPAAPPRAKASRVVSTNRIISTIVMILAHPDYS